MGAVQQALLSAVGYDPAQHDEHFASVVLLLHGDGTNGSTSIVDSSSHANTVTVSGSTALSTAEKKFGTASIKGAASSYWQCALGSLGNMTGDFTIESWVKNGNNTVFFTSTAGAYLYNDAFVGYGGSALSFSGLLATAGAIGLPWTHWAISRVGSSLKSFVNGVLIDTKTYSGAVDLSTIRGGMFIPNGNLHFEGYYDEFRVTQGVGRYAASFSVPTSAFADQV